MVNLEYGSVTEVMAAVAEWLATRDNFGSGGDEDYRWWQTMPDGIRKAYERIQEAKENEMMDAESESQIEHEVRRNADNYMNSCWDINNCTLRDLKRLIVSFVQEAFEEDPHAFVEDIATMGKVIMPDHIVVLAKAAIASGAAGAAFDEARCLLKTNQ